MYPEQSTMDVFGGSLLYAIGTCAVLLGIVGFMVIDYASVQRRNSIDTLVLKYGAVTIAMLAFLVVGFGIWMWQFNQAFGVPNALSAAISAWWIGGTMVSVPAVQVDPAVMPAADHVQIFVPFTAAYAGFLVSLIHSSMLERISARALFVMAAVWGAFLLPLLLYLTWGSVSPLTNEGLHDFVGVFTYIAVGLWALMFVWKMGPAPKPVQTAAESPNVALIAIGVGVLLVAIPLFALGCGYVIPGTGYIGISGNTSGFGLVLMNYFAAIVGGGIAGLVLAYRTSASSWVFLGTIAGYIGASASLDIATPIVCLFIGGGGMLSAFAMERILNAVKFPERKVVPLGLGAGTFGAIIPGFVGWGIKSGGFPGITEGPFAFQAAEISPQMQLLGVGVTIAVTAAVAIVTFFVVSAVGQLSVNDEKGDAGRDRSFWTPAE